GPREIRRIRRQAGHRLERGRGAGGTVDVADASRGRAVGIERRSERLGRRRQAEVLGHADERGLVRPGKNGPGDRIVMQLQLPRGRRVRLPGGGLEQVVSSVRPATRPIIERPELSVTNALLTSTPFSVTATSARGTPGGPV